MAWRASMVWWLAWSAWAGDPLAEVGSSGDRQEGDRVPVILDPPDWGAGDATYDLVLEEAVAHPAWGRRPFWLPGPDGVLRPLEAYDPSRLFEVAPPPVKEAAAVRPVVHPGPRDGFLSGRAVYMSQCHGYIYYDSLGRHSTQRGILFSTVEDFHNPEGANAFLIPMLEHAGAMVYTARERDMNGVRAIVDNGDAGYTEVGGPFENGLAGWATPTTLTYGQDPFDAGTTRRFRENSGGVARWEPDVPADGSYAIYVSWDSDSTHSAAAHYRITHPGGVIDRVFDQRVHGSTWQYVETLWLPQGRGGLTVELIADGTGSAWLSADAVRVGGGPNVISRSGDKVAARLWEMGAVGYNQFNGAPSSVYDPFGNGDGTDPTTRSRWAAWEHPSGEDAVYLSWHSNATASGTARGTVTYFAGGGPDAPSSEPAECSTPAVQGSYSLARAVQDEMIDVFQAKYESNWLDRDIGTACFAEVNPNHNPEMPSALVELAFHDNEIDASYLKDPTFRWDSARAMYRGVVRYFAERDGVTPVFLPEPPQGLSLRHEADGSLVLDWQDGDIGAPYGDAPAGYLVETSADGRVWDESFATTARSVTLDWPAGTTRFVRVRAVNDGGTSFPSEVIGARRADGCTAPVLVVSAFDRFDAGLLPTRPAPYIGTVVTMDLPRVNPANTAQIAGQALAAAGWAFDSVSDERLEDVDLSVYKAIWWVAGEESSGTSVMTPPQQLALEAALDGGTALFVSGSEVLWDLDAKGSADDKAFAADVLGATMASDDAGTTAASGAGVLEGLDLSFGEDVGGAWPVDYPDALTSTRTPIARYAGGAIAGVLGDGVALLGFPFEAIGKDSVRVAAADALLDALAPGATPSGEGACEVVGPGETDDGPGPDTADTGRGDEASDLAGLSRVRVARGCDASGGLAGMAGWGSILFLMLARRRRQG